MANVTGIRFNRAGKIYYFEAGDIALAAADDANALIHRTAEIDRIAGVITDGITGRFDYAGQLAGGFSKDRGAVYEALEMWLDYWRDLLLVKLGSEATVTNIDRKQELTETADGYRPGQIKEFIESIRRTAEQLRQNVNPRLALEVLMLDIPIKGGGATNG